MTSTIQSLPLMVILFIITTYLYCHDEQNLNGVWILDDKATISMNPIVTGKVSEQEVWNRDFWGMHDLKDSQSHKSWRPLCSLSYVWNLRYFYKSNHENEYYNVDTDNALGEEYTYWFHVVDRVLHGIVSALVLPVARYMFLRNRNISSWNLFLVALLFAVHPIHVEAAANSTGRAEVLCTLFYFMAFLSYAKIAVESQYINLKTRDVGKDVSSLKSSVLRNIGGVLVSQAFTLASLLCKENGVTAPVMAIIWDLFIATNTSLKELIHVLSSNSQNDEKVHQTSEGCSLIQKSLKKRRKQCMLFLFRAVLSLMGCLVMSVWRLSKNGDSKPNFVCEQNPAACESRKDLRFFHYTYLWFFNFWLMLYPNWLSPDWSGESIPLIDEHWATDPRFGVVILTWAVMLAVIIQTLLAVLVGGANDSSSSQDGNILASDYSLRRNLTAFYWMFIPFLLSSNLFVHVGFVVADRTLYLPTFGFCLLLMEAISFLGSFVGIKADSLRKDNLRKENAKLPNIVKSITILLVLLL